MHPRTGEWVASSANCTISLYQAEKSSAWEVSPLSFAMLSILWAGLHTPASTLSRLSVGAREQLVESDHPLSPVSIERTTHRPVSTSSGPITMTREAPVWLATLNCRPTPRLR